MTSSDQTPSTSSPSPDDTASSTEPLEEILEEISVLEKGSGFWPVFLSTFVTIFLAELGDKTQVTTMLISAESKAPVTVFLGAGLALIATSLIGVLLGQWMSTRVSDETLDLCAGILLLLISIGLVGDIMSH